jgi:transposase
MLLDQQLREIGRRIRKILTSCAGPTNEQGETLPDAGVLLSIPGVGPVVAATFLAEATRPIRERDHHALRCYAGTAPIN